MQIASLPAHSLGWRAEGGVSRDFRTHWKLNLLTIVVLRLENSERNTAISNIASVISKDESPISSEVVFLGLKKAISVDGERWKKKWKNEKKKKKKKTTTRVCPAKSMWNELLNFSPYQWTSRINVFFSVSAPISPGCIPRRWVIISEDYLVVHDWYTLSLPMFVRRNM